MTLLVWLLLVPHDGTSRPITFIVVKPSCVPCAPLQSMCRPVLTLPPALPAVNAGISSSEWMRAYETSVLAMIRQLSSNVPSPSFTLAKASTKYAQDSIERRRNHEAFG